MNGKKQREEHVLAGLSSAPSNARIIRTAATMAQAFGARFTALFVRTEAFPAMSGADRERLEQHIRLAEELGAVVETVCADDVSSQIAEYARLAGVPKIVVGRRAARRQFPWQKPTLTEKLCAINPNAEIYIIPDAAAAAYRPRPLRQRSSLRRLLREGALLAGVLALCTLLGFGLARLGFTEANIIMIYLLGVMLTAAVSASRLCCVLSAVGSVLVFGFFFTQPVFSLKVYEQDYLLTLPVMLVAALSVGTLTARLRSHNREMARAAYRTNLLLETVQLLQSADSVTDILQITSRQSSKLLGREVTVLPGMAAATEAGATVISLGTQPLASAVVRGGEAPDSYEQSLLLSLLGECALALEKQRSERAMEEARLQSRNQKLRADLLRSLSHDLRTPLTTISGNAGVLLAGREPNAEARRQMYADILEDSLWLTRIVENLLSVTRLEEGRLDLCCRLQLVEEIVEEALAHMERRLEGRPVSTEYEEELLFVRCDAGLVVRVLVNLLDNAVKYTPAGSALSVRARREGKWVRLSVVDEGGGIADGEKERVFEMFYTGEGAVADSRRSMGLGLGLCREIISAHGGTIRVEDNSPCGAVFTFTLPAGEVDVRE
ncbi:MAG: DUF4118 domain-containing protein [Oscillospiraceae bacterium]|nr:DUF4118 domain-containing protein [Oscillospiraceae bacterium]